MTPKQSKALARQLHVVAHGLGIHGWDLRVADAPCEDGAAAAVSCVYGRKIAHVSFAHDWWEMEAAERHHVLVHELLHIVLDPIRTYLNETIPALIGGPAATAVQEATRQHEEHAVDQLASALAPYLPIMEDV